MENISLVFKNLFPKKKQYLLLTLFFVLIIIWIIFYFPYYTKLKRIRQENENLLTRIEKVKQEIFDYEEKSRRIKKDPYLLEKVAREDLGVAKDGEIVVDIKD